jgi:hypothetical protein
VVGLLNLFDASSHFLEAARLCSLYEGKKTAPHSGSVGTSQRHVELFRTEFDEIVIDDTENN